MSETSKNSTGSLRVALDAMGGDNAPAEIIRGAYLASKEYPTAEIVLVGKGKAIQEVLAGKEYSGFMPIIVEASEQILMSDPPALSIRRKRKSSIVVGLDLVKKNEAGAFVSCGNTGAMVCGSILSLGLINKVERPGIALVIPTLQGVSLMMDVGANIDPKPTHLMQYALMAEVYSRQVLERENPSVGLLNIGEEESKGTGFLKDATVLLKKYCSNFIGNIEPKDIFKGRCDCVICDGLAGNIALKVSEGMSEAMGHFLISEIKKDFLSKLGMLLVKRSFKKFKKIVDYTEHGGAPLLGVNGVVIIGHGRSNAKAVKNAIRVALRELERDITGEIEEKVNEASQGLC